MLEKKSINVALLGYGTVGSGVFAVLKENEKQISSRIKFSTGKEVGITVKKILVRNPDKYKNVPKDLLAKNIDEIISDKEIDIVVEVMGGDTFAKECMQKAMQNGKHIVTANKLAIAKSNGELEETAKSNNVEFEFEASVCGAIPVIRVINESLEANNILDMSGIVNGTTNYILSLMTNEKKSYDEALKSAQDLGFAEADPTSDVEGFDSMYKMSILCKQAFGKYPKPENITREGISKTSPSDIESADKNGEVIKLIAKGYIKNEEPFVEVKPTRISKTLPLANVGGAGNAVSINCDNAGEIVLQGQGAGSRPTASAVVSDIINLSKKLLRG